MNCHQNTEAADLLGGLRPLRGREVLVREFRERARIFLSKCAAATVQTNDENSCHRELAHGSSPSMDNVDVTSIMALVHVSPVPIPIFRFGGVRKKAARQIIAKSPHVLSCLT